jgi:hypothetical protein
MSQIVLLPWLPFWLIALLCGAIAASALFSLWRGGGGLWRLVFAVALAGVLLGPAQRREQRAAEPDIGVIIVDRSASMDLDTRGAQAARAVASLRQSGGIEWRMVDAPRPTQGAERTDLLGRLDGALATVPPERLAGAILVTDGQVHDRLDAARLAALGRPVHVLLAGDPKLADRRLTLVSAPPYAIVPQTARLTLRVDAPAETGAVPVTWSLDGVAQAPLSVMPGKPFTLPVPVERRGGVDVTATVAPAPAERVTVNNSIATRVTGVRDRLKVLLVSGQPYAGARLWRDVLKGDPAIDMVHFTILRLPTSRDPTPNNELSLIPFPVDELFRQRLPSFDLIIFDRYSSLDLLDPAYLDAVAEWVLDGGALLTIGGPEFAAPDGLGATGLERVLPALPSGRTNEGSAVPMLTPDGRRHPLTDVLAQAPTWGAWTRWTTVTPRAGRTLLSLNGAPLLQISEEGKGRVALLASDQLWLWARGTPAGPWDVLLRRLAHWLMHEPDLEAERLQLRTGPEGLSISRKGFDLGDPVAQVRRPDGQTQQVPLAPQADGSLGATLSGAGPGLYQVRAGGLSRAILVGGEAPEFQDIRPSAARLEPLAKASGGGVFWLNDGVPAIRRVAPGDTAAGSGWLGLVRGSGGRVLGVEDRPLLPSWASLIALAALALAAWLAERRGARQRR